MPTFVSFQQIVLVKNYHQI